MEAQNKIKNRLNKLFPKNVAEQLSGDIVKLAKSYNSNSNSSWSFSEKDALLICYGDSLKDKGRAPLESLTGFYNQKLKGAFNYIHILPFYPYTSDDGFSVVDYREVNPELGNWEHIQALGKNCNLVFDAVINHVSASSKYMIGQCQGDPQYEDFIVTSSPDVDLSSVTRPRNLPLLHEFETHAGPKWFWTTFSRDQVDLNFRNPKVLLEILDVLLFYAKMGAKMIRLDAVPFVWKVIGTSCSHLPENHEIVKLIRDVFNLAFPEMILLSETNVPHHENLAYFGDGSDEAQMIYNFTLAPLIAYSILTSNCQTFAKWAAGLEQISEQTTFLNITATHDGLGVRPLEGILPPEEVGILVKRTLDNGGKIGEKKNPDGSVSPYELNITYFDLLNSAEDKNNLDLCYDKFLLSQVVPLSFMGMPGVYIQSLFACENDYEGYAKTNMPRSLNRKKWDYSEALSRLEKDEHCSRFFGKFRALLLLRGKQKAFHPLSQQEILNSPKEIFALKRIGDSGQTILAVHNVSAQNQIWKGPSDYKGTDIISGKEMDVSNLSLSPYQFFWIELDLI